MTDIEPGAFDQKAASGWGEAARRLRIIRRYLANPDRGVEEADAAAREIGIGRRMFYQLVEVLSSDGPSAKAASRGGRRLDDAVEKAIGEAIAACPIDAPFHIVGEKAREIATARSLAPPSDRAVARRVREARAGDRTLPSIRLIIDHAPLEIAVADGADTIPPWITIAIDESRPAIVAFRLSTSAPDHEDALRVALDALSRMDAAPPPTIEMQGAHGSGWNETRQVLRKRGIDVTGRNHAHLPSGAAIQRAVGARIAGIPIRPRLDPATLRERTGKMTPISLDLLSSIVAYRLGVPAT